MSERATHDRQALIANGTLQKFYNTAEIQHVLASDENDLNLVTDAIVGIVYDHDPRFAELLLDYFDGETIVAIHDNYPDVIEKNRQIGKFAVFEAARCLETSLIPTLGERAAFAIPEDELAISDNLYDEIVLLAEKGMIGKNHAKALLLLFEEVKVATRTYKIDQLILHARDDISQRIPYSRELTMADEKHQAARTILSLFSGKGVKYAAGLKATGMDLAMYIYSKENPERSSAEIEQYIKRQLVWALNNLYTKTEIM